MKQQKYSTNTAGAQGGKAGQGWPHAMPEA